MDKYTKYQNCPKCEGNITADCWDFASYFEVTMFCDDCGFTWSEAYTFSYNAVEGEEEENA